MSASPLAIALIGAVLIGAILGVSAVLVGRIAERFGEDPKWWQLRMLPLNVFGPFVAWVVLSRRGGGRGGFA